MQFKANAYLKDRETIELDFDIKSTDYYLYKVQHLPTRHFNIKTKKWSCPLNKVIVQQLKEIGFKIDPKVTQILENKPKVISIDPKLKLKPREYQKECIGFVESQNGKAIIGMPAGSGKTLIAIGWMHYRSVYPALIVCPASLKLNWQREIEKFLGKSSTILYSSPKKGQRLEDSIYIINYDILNKWKGILLKHKFKLMILDESNAIKNYSSLRSKTSISLSKKIPHILPMTATAVENGPMDLWTSFKVINPKLFPNRHTFGIRYCAAKHNGWGWDYKGASNLKELKEQLDDIMIRKEKHEILPELPERTRVVIPLELDNLKQYIATERQFISNYIPGQSRINTMAKMEALKQAANKGKFKQIIEWVGNYLESGNKLIVFGIHTAMVEGIYKEFSKQAVLLYGKQTPKQKQESIDKFQKDKKIRLMSANIRSGGVGLNLTAAADTCIIELPWNPALLEQAESRTNRIGQLAEKTVNYYFIAQRTIESDLMEILDNKQKIMLRILDGKEVDPQDLLLELIKSIKKRNKKG